MTPEHNEINYKCKVHGKLQLESLNKNGRERNGKQSYACKICSKVRDDARYSKRKEKVAENFTIWRKNNKERQKETSLRGYYKRKKNSCYQEKSRAYRLNVAAELKDVYVRKLLNRNSYLSASKIPHELIELKRTTIQIQREIRETRKRGAK